MPTALSTSPTGNQAIDGVIGSSYWANVNITYSFPASSSLYVGTGYTSISGFGGFNASQMTAARNALSQISNFTNLNFTEVTETLATEATIRFAEASSYTTDFTYTSGVGTAEAWSPISHSVGGDTWFNTSNFNNPQVGTYGFSTIMHELGHSLGLKHPHEAGSFGATPTPQDAIEYSVMSYNSYAGNTNSFYVNEQFGYSHTYMMLDIAALQQLYGADYGYNNGNTVYTFTPGQARLFETIWDGGGRDTYDFTSYSTNLQISLEAGQYSNTNAGQSALLNSYEVSVNGDAPIYASGNVYNSLLFNGNFASLIEDVWGGAGNDVILGNQADNALQGYGGNDTLSGGAGNDVLSGNDGADTLRGQFGNDVLNGGAGNDRMYGNNGFDVLNGDDGADFLFGNKGNDILNGGIGNDTLNGNEGADTLRGQFGNDVLNGGAGNDRMYGNNGFDVLNGGNGVDVLFGNNGNDTLNGGGGNDVLNGNNGADRMRGQLGDDVLNGGAGNDRLHGNTGFDTLNGGAGNDWLFGQSDTDNLFGGFGNDTLDGGTESDVFHFENGAGNDVINNFEDGLDLLNFAAIATVTSISDVSLNVISATQTEIGFNDGVSSFTLTVNSASPLIIDAGDFLFT